ncbi:MAG TPA: hypothetical protein VIG74_05075, partial [Alphaproteobacteria bacterium]
VQRIRSPGFYEEDKGAPKLGESFLVGKWDAAGKADQNVMLTSLTQDIGPEIGQSAPQRDAPKASARDFA